MISRSGMVTPSGARAFPEVGRLDGPGSPTAADWAVNKAKYLLRPVLLGLTLVIFVFAAAVWQARWAAAGSAVGIDYRTFVDEGHRLLAGSPYLPYQLAGPYEAAPEPPRLDPAAVPFLYPPPFALVGVALTVLPWPAWWIVPLGILAWCIASWRPAPWAWPLLALALAWPATSAVVIVGGSTMWAAALVAVGLRFGWPAALIVLKPTLLPFALVGVRRRSWWVAAGALGLVSLAMLPLWGEYIAAVRNVTDASPWYSLGDLPILLAPVVACLSRRGCNPTPARHRRPRPARRPRAGWRTARRPGWLSR